MGGNNFRLGRASAARNGVSGPGLGLIHFISQIISGSGPIFPAWLNLRIMVLLEVEEHQKVQRDKKGRPNKQQHVTKTATRRGQGSAWSASKSNYDAPSKVPSPQPPPHFDEDGHSDIPRG